jgi:hypothetical protein
MLFKDSDLAPQNDRNQYEANKDILQTEIQGSIHSLNVSEIQSSEED